MEAMGIGVSRPVLVSEIEQTIWILGELHKIIKPEAGEDGVLTRGIPGVDYKAPIGEFLAFKERLIGELELCGRSMIQLAGIVLSSNH